MVCAEIENRMVAGDKLRLREPPEAEEKLNESGWVNIKTRTFVSDADAFDYALEQCFEVVPVGVREIKWTDEFKEMLVEWFYSGDYWVKEDWGNE